VGGDIPKYLLSLSRSRIRNGDEEHARPNGEEGADAGFRCGTISSVSLPRSSRRARVLMD
jgi:hypothetical protein